MIQATSLEQTRARGPSLLLPAKAPQMAKDSTITFCDSTVSPVAGCSLPCLLWPHMETLRHSIGWYLGQEHEIPKAQALTYVGWAIEKLGIKTEADVYHLRVEFTFQTLATSSILTDDLEEARQHLERFIKAQFQCYAGLLHLRHGTNPLQPDKAPSDGYGESFREPTFFRGRMAEAANWSNLKGKPRPNKPWLNGLPRIILVSDMGEILSHGYSPEHVKSEIIDVVSSPKGRRHWWLWSTRNAQGMAQFSVWMSRRGIQWPSNLVPLLSVNTRDDLEKLPELFRVPSALRALWAQPLLEPLLLDVEGIDWLIVGGEGGAHANEFELNRAWQLRRYCSYKNVPFFMAQLGSAPLIDGVAYSNNDGKNNIDWEHWPEEFRVREIPELKFPRFSGQRSPNKRTQLP